LSPFEESPPASDDEQKVEAVVVVNPPPAKQRPVRLDRRLSLTGELGWNSLAGFGFNLGYHAVPQVTVEGGAGISLEGWRLGLRGRYNFTTGPATPFLGAGLLSSGGIEPVEVPSQEDENVTQAVLRVRPSKFIQTVFGVDWITREGFTVVSTLGWAWLLGGSNIEVLSGQPTPLQARGFRVFFGGGLVLSLALGYTFR
jgi:hypothetical protein